MEKIIKLLNEYEKEKGLKSWIHIRWKIWPHWELLHWATAWAWYSELKLISKKYWFIQWLVENNKIDIEKMKDNSELYIKYSSNKSEEDAIVDIILMLLSIQEQPIDFLISVLKD